MIPYSRLLLTFGWVVLAGSIDLQERIGTCRPFALNTTQYVFANEGVWFPQYRSVDDKQHTKGNNYTCHTIFEKVYVDEVEPTKLESDSYYTLNGVVVKDPYTSTYEKTKVRGKLETSVNIKDHGSHRIFNYVLKVTPQYRVRYVCTDFKKTIPGVTAIYIETRKASPTLRTITDAHEVLLKHGLTKTMVRINQKNCTRPINMKGYISMWTDDKSAPPK